MPQDPYASIATAVDPYADIARTLPTLEGIGNKMFAGTPLTPEEQDFYKQTVHANAAAITDKYAQSGLLTLGGGGLRDVAGKALEAAGGASAVRRASEAIGKLDPDSIGILSPRMGNLIRTIQKGGRWVEKLAGLGEGSEAVAKEVEKGQPAAEQYLRDTVAAQAERAKLPPYPRVSEGLPEVEAHQPRAEQFLREAIAGGRSKPTLAELNPAVNSPVRSLPGQIGREVIGEWPKPAQPIPPRSGLMLPAGPVAATAEGALPSVAAEAVPRTLSGESALRQILGGQDNTALLKIAKSRGMNVAQEAQLKPGVGDKLLIEKIVDHFSPEELDELKARYLETSRFRHEFGDIGAEAWKTLSLQTYFPEVTLPKAVIARTHAAILKAAAKQIENGAAGEGDDLTSVLEESVKRAKQGSH